MYLDNSTTSYPKPEEVIRTVQSVLRSAGSSAGRGGGIVREADRILFRARERIKEFFHMPSSDRIIFTANATTSLNLAIKGILKSGDHVITSSMEHGAVMRPLRGLEKRGIHKTVIRCSAEGSFPVDELEKEILPSTKMIILNHASNITGTIAPVRKAGDIAHKHNVLFLVDAAQTAGLLPIDVDQDKIDLLACTGHKSLLGPQGTGFLYIREGVDIDPLIEGGTGSFSESDDTPLSLPDRYEAGTQNTAGIAGISAGIAFIRGEGRNTIRERERHLVSMILQGLAEIPGIQLYGPSDPEARTSAVSFTIKGKDPADAGNMLAEKHHIICRVGLHCSPWGHKTIGTFPEGTIRVSPGYFTKETEIVSFLRVMQEM